MLDEFFRYLWGPGYTAHCLEVAEDPARAIVWILANLAVAFAYFRIPHEIGIWAKATSLSLSSAIAWMFRAFIFMCGVSHIAMPFVMPSASWLFIVTVFLPLAVISCGVYVALRVYRRRIVSVLQMARILLSSASASAAQR